MNIDNEETPKPKGTLSSKLSVMPRDSDGFGDIYGGWIVSQMDLAGSTYAQQLARGKVATVAIESMSFMLPVTVGSIISCYTELLSIGRSSIKVNVEVWVCYPAEDEQRKVTESMFTFVAINKNRRTRQVPR